ncbi:helix-turn-helix domain-containing protein [Mycolicibacterium setense]|uniref:helix-turn-helix domain-containing protein n=1 Tax=Mycolicibacterium setense TaxID=431269 RepID=UPI0009E5DE9D|nr:helix-turn-helix transcriptional regulator [Mycolicibacterium setense]MCV7111337.1 helix-turn-helix transcriptional regulator [Mycolicibacterium setense]
MAGRVPDAGATAKTVTENVRKLRKLQNLTWTQLSERLEAIEWILTPVAIKNIEAGKRRVTVDDLTALAAALEVSPVSLLMPPANEETTSVTATGIQGTITAGQLWNWLTSDDAAPQFGKVRIAYVYTVCPPWVAKRKDRENALLLLQEINDQRESRPESGDGDDK